METPSGDTTNPAPFLFVELCQSKLTKVLRNAFAQIEDKTPLKFKFPSGDTTSLAPFLFLEPGHSKLKRY